LLYANNFILAQDYTYSNVQFYIPPNQWQTEVSLWFSTCLAKEQQWAVEWATAPRNTESSLGKNITKLFSFNSPTTQAGQAQCKQQMVRNAAGFINFPVLGISLIVGLGGLIIIAGCTVDLFARRFSRKQSVYKREEWDAHEVLALHKAAYVAHGYDVDGLNGQLPPIMTFRSAHESNYQQDSPVEAFKDGYVTTMAQGYSYPNTVYSNENFTTAAPAYGYPNTMYSNQIIY
jgi:hypothetical protein